MRKLLTVIAVVALSLVVLAPAAAAAPVFKINTTIEFGPVDVWNPCEGEFVDDVAGTVHINGQLQLNSNNISGHLHANAHATGTGRDTEAPYVGGGSAKVNFSANGNNDQFQGSINFNGRLNGRGSVANARLHFNGHLTVNAAGDVTSAFLNVGTSC